MDYAAMSLEKPARYFPIARGLYEVTPGLKLLGTGFGNGDIDGRVFQIDTDFQAFLDNKRACRADRLGKYLATCDLSPAVESALIDWLVDRLIGEYPHYFSLSVFGKNRRVECALTGEVGELDEKNQLVGWEYVSAFDALVNQVPEDVCLIRLEAGRDWLAAGHVCGPGHWSVQEKIGKPFTAIHDPVPGIAPINARAGQFVEMMIQRGPFVRFAWGFGTDERLNHHPIPPVGVDSKQWHGRRFDLNDPTFFLRVERQVMWGLPAVRAAIFTIHVSHLNGNQIRQNPAERSQLIAALESMSDESRRYKGLDGSVEAVVGWLNGNDERGMVNEK